MSNLCIVSTNSNLKVKSIFNNLINVQISKRIFCDRKSGTSSLKACYQNTLNENIKNILNNQELKEMNDNDKYYLLEDFFSKQLSSGLIVVDKNYGLYPAFSGKTPEDIAECFMKLYNDNNDYIYKNKFLQINPDTWPELKTQNTDPKKYHDIGALLNL